MPIPSSAPAALDARVAALDAALSRLEAAERAVRVAEAARLEAFASVFDVAAAGSGTGLRSIPTGRGGEILYRTVRAEAAAALRHSEQTVERCFNRAHALTFSYPRTLDALRDGSISEQHTAVIVDAGIVVGDADDPDAVLRRAGYEHAVLEHARFETPSRLRPIARRIAEQYAQRPLDERHAEARRRRRVYLADGDDGMSDLVAHLTAAEEHGIYAELTRRSREIERAQAAQAERDTDLPSERRTRDEIRADLLAEIVLGAASKPASPHASAGRGAPRAQVQVVVPVECLTSPDGSDHADMSEELGSPTARPAPTLAGYGPIDTDTARRLAGGSNSWELVRVHVGSGGALTDDPGGVPADLSAVLAHSATLLASSGTPPENSGTLLAVDRYRPSAAMRRHLSARDQHCRFPGCRAPLARCDIDHTVDAALGGATATDNLAHLCRGHHTLKHHGGWRVWQQEDGALDWRSPTGRRYRERPPGRVLFISMSERSPMPERIPDSERTRAPDARSTSHSASSLLLQ
ncbi:HNH endonuclease signature motif containing protein [Leucobacter triazinivorans]|uniref:HNH endonuclease n=1 Tax=Leucobacter triazinivorans TaxID=1784719 RepID=A0A4P6KBG4_9MICO|nr:HNH endonuclease signature motif containing protein [Leucobacter triazinivorans]QBE47452.1 HNH endonuclease [Leucobacter triazinivorans]